MSLASQVSSALSRVGAEIKAVRGELFGTALSLASAKEMYSGQDLYAYGNSWMDASYFITRIPEKLGFTLVANKATGGYRMQDTATTANSPGAKNWLVGTTGTVVINDLGNNMGDPDTPANRGAALESARALCAILSASSKVEQGSFTFSTTPAWSNTALTYDGASGGTYAITTNMGSYVDITVPTTGTHYLMLYGGNGAAFNTAVATVTQNGKTIAVKDTQSKSYLTAYRNTIGVSPVPVRLPNVQAGTIRVTFTNPNNISGTVYGAVDCYLTQQANPPLLLWTKPVAVKDSSYINKPSLLAYLRTIPDLLAAEFPNVVVADPNAGWNPDTMLLPDLLHPNPLGQNHMAGVITSALIRAKMLRSGDNRYTRWANVRQYGAVGDGVTDDTGAVAMAQYSNPGLPLYFPTGQYNVTSLPPTPNGMTYLGDGPDASEILWGGTGTLIDLVNKQNVNFRGIGIFITGTTATAISMSQCFQCTMDWVKIRGNHTGGTGTTYHNTIGVDFKDNTGNTRVHNSMFNNLGVGTRANCIQNEYTNCKWTTCYRSTLGTGNNDNSGGVYIGCEFISDANVNSTLTHVEIDGKANTWYFSGCWFEGSTKGMVIGKVNVGGPASLTMTGCKIGARSVGIEMNVCRQAAWFGLDFNEDQGSVMQELVFATVNGTMGAQCIEGTAIHCRTTLRGDFQMSDFPQYWHVFTKGNTYLGNLYSRSNITADGTVTGGVLKQTYTAAANTILQGNAIGEGIWVPRQQNQIWDSEMPMNALPIAAGYVGYSDAIGGAQVNNPYNAAGILLDSIGFRIDDPAGVVGTNTVTIQLYLGTPTSAENTLLGTMTIASGQNNQSIALGTPVACGHNAVLRAKITTGSGTLPGPSRIHWRGRYQ